MNEAETVKQSFLPPKTAQNYGLFGYAGAMCDLAIKRDDPDWMGECIDLGFVDADARMLCGGTVLEFCEKNAPKCAAVLRERQQ